MITFSRRKAAAQLSLTPSLATSHKEIAADHGAEQLLPHFCKPKVHPCRVKRCNVSADMPHTGRDKAAKTTCISYEPEDIQQQPDAAPVVKTRGNSAPFQKLPSGQQHADGRSLPPAPITATKKVPQNSQQGPGTSATPLTGPNTLSGSIEPEMSSGASADGNLVSSDDDASSYEPSSREQASPDTEERGPPVSRPPLHPKTFSKHGHNVVQRKSRASDDAVKPANHHKSLVAPIVQGNEQGRDSVQDSLPKTAKRQRLTKTILQLQPDETPCRLSSCQRDLFATEADKSEKNHGIGLCSPKRPLRTPVSICQLLHKKADVHVSKAAVHSMAAGDGVLVEMPPGFDVTGDTGSIGRFNATSDGMNVSVEMDVKGIMYSTAAAPCASSLLLVKVINTGDGAAGAATVELATNEFVQAIQLESSADVAARREWSGEDDDYLNLPLAAADQRSKAKASKAKGKHKSQTKTTSRKK